MTLDRIPEKRFTEYLDEISRKLRIDLRIDGDSIQMDKEAGSLLLRTVAIVFASVVSMAKDYQRTSGHEAMTNDDVYHALWALDIKCKLMRRICGMNPDLICEVCTAIESHREDMNGLPVGNPFNQCDEQYGLFFWGGPEEKEKHGKTML